MQIACAPSVVLSYAFALACILTCSGWYSAFPVESHTCIRSEFIMKCQSLSEVPKKRGIAFPEIPSKEVRWPASLFMKLYFFLDFCEQRGMQAQHSVTQPLLGWPLLEDLPLQIISRLVISQPFLGMSHSWRPRFLKLFSSGALESCESLYRCLRL